jgi:hypothetical protein
MAKGILFNLGSICILEVFFMKKGLSLGVIFTAITMYAGLPTVSYAVNDIRASIPVISENQNEAHYDKLSKISMQQAMQVALDKISKGKIIEAKLENENGRLIYDIEAVNPKNKTMEIKVDADSGKVLKIAKDDNDKDKAHAEHKHGKEMESTEILEENLNEKENED